MEKKKLELKDLKVVRWKVNNDLSKPCLMANSFVSRPAMEGTATYLHDDSQLVEKLAHDDLRQTVTCLLLEPDKPIVRKNKKTGEFYLAFCTLKDITNVKRKMFANPETMFMTTVQHLVEVKPESIDDLPRVDNLWQIENSKLDMSAALGQGPYNVGSLLATYYIPNKEMYFLFRDNDLAFSGEFDFGDGVPATEEEIKTLNIKTQKLSNMKLPKINLSKWFRPAAKTAALMEYTTNDGKVISIDDSTGVATIDGIAAPDGDYNVVVDGTDYTITVKDGKAVPVADSQDTANASAAATNKPADDNMAQIAAAANAKLAKEELEKLEASKLADEKSKTDLKDEAPTVEKLSVTLLEKETAITELKSQVEKLTEDLKTAGDKSKIINTAPAFNEDITKMSTHELITHNLRKMAFEQGVK